MKPLEILKVAIKEWVLIVPLDLQSNELTSGEIAFERLDMIDFMGCRFTFYLC